MQATARVNAATAEPLPHARSWVGRVQRAIERLPVPAWTVYVSAWLALAGLQTIVKWLDGAYPFGTLFAFHLVFSGSGIYAFAIMHHLDRVAARGLEAFEPALDADRDELAALAARLTTMPARLVLLATLAGVAWGVFFRLLVVPPYLASFRLATSPASAVVDVLLLLLLWSMLSLLVVHTMHQLRAVSHIYANHARIDLFRMRPLYAFSPLAARTAISLLALGLVWFATAPGILDKTAILAILVVLGLLGVGTFVAPLLGILQRIRAEKQRLLADHHIRAQAMLTRFHDDLDAGDLQHADAHNKAMATLDLEQARLERMPIWPWRAGTLRGLLTAVFLPLFVWGVQQALLRML